MLRASSLFVASMLLLTAPSCDTVGGESGRGEARPAVAPPKLSRVELLPAKIDRSTTQRVEVRDPLSIAATQIDLHRQTDGVVDILWIIDDSGSMKNQRSTLVNNFDRFIQELLKLKVNFQIGVISTNATDKGELRGTTKIIKNSTPNPRSVFLANTTFPDSRTRWEQGLRMMQLAVSPPLATIGANMGFLRPNAALAVIAVSDEDDASYGDPSYYVRFLREAKGKGNENLVSFSVIGGTLPNGCTPPGEEGLWGSLAEPALRYTTVADKMKGTVGSICSDSFEDTLLRIAEALNTLRRDFPLSLKPDAATLSVIVNGLNIPSDVINGWQYRPETQSISFRGSFIPPPGALIRIEYVISP